VEALDEVEVEALDKMQVVVLDKVEVMAPEDVKVWVVLVHGSGIGGLQPLRVGSNKTF